MAELTDVEKAFCQYWRSVLEVGAIYSIGQFPTNAGSMGASTARDILDAFTHRVFDDPSVAQTSRLFFDVLLLRPAVRVRAQSAGRGADMGDIIVRVSDSLQAQGSTPRLRADRAHSANISLRYWRLSMNVKAILSSLFRWEFADYSTTVTMIPHSQSLRPSRAPTLSDDALCTDQHILNIAMGAASTCGDWFP